MKKILYCFILTLFPFIVFADNAKRDDWINPYLIKGYISYNDFNNFISSKDERAQSFGTAYLSGIVNTFNWENIAREQNGLPKIYCAKSALQLPEVKKLMNQYANLFNGEPIKKFGDGDLYFFVRLTVRYYHPCPEENK